MRLLKQLTCLALLGSGLTVIAAAGPAGADPDGADGKPGLLQQLRSGADGSVTISGESATDQVGFLRAGRNGDLLASSDARPAAKADAFLDQYARLFGAKADQLVRESVRSDRYGATVAYSQRYQGVPVFGGMLLAHFDKGGALTSVNGVAVPDLDLSVDPVFGEAAAQERAVRTVKADPPGHDGETADTTGIEAASTQLYVYRDGLVRGQAGDVDLVWQVEVTNEANIRDMVFISATTGKPVNRYSMIHDALERHLLEADGSTDPSTFEEIWTEGDPFPGTLNEDQQNEVVGTGESYWFFNNVFGRDSYDDQGHSMTTVNNDGRIACPNANWNGTTTNYCDGVTSDDVVAHEWGHAYTEFTHGLIYQWQPGALNESYSDIWGETVDLINGRMDEEEGDLESPRPVGACSTHSPARPLVTINSPADIAQDCLTAGAQFGAQLDSTGITGDVVIGEDAVEDGNPPGTATDGCSPLDNAADVAGNVVMVDRGFCAFTVKAQNATDASATALIVGNNVEGVNTMSGEAPGVTIPSVMIPLSNRNDIVGAIDGGATVNVTMKDDVDSRQDSYRWLMGEDSTAFGGAIRDMWTPTCYGDPGKVTDAEYYCAADDGGGVHSNSGVPNHGYALLVDGGEYNGVTVPAIGLTKAAAIYHRAMVNYQTPTTDFADHADSLEVACEDLIGLDINELSTDPNDSTVSDEVIIGADCTAVSAMVGAVELKKEPVQCNFQPLLDPNAPSVCAKNEKRNVVFRERFEDGLAGWTKSSAAVYDPDAGKIDWRADASLPRNRKGTAAYATGPDEGDCSGAAGDISGVSRLASRPITVAAAGAKDLRLTFDHYVATEAGFDGGNVKVSVNGGGFEAVPDGAYIFNASNTTITPAAGGNTNPLAGEPGFSGTDGGEVFGTWGQSQIALGMLGVKAGDKIRVRFDFGRDGCGGLDGWYVDNVTVSTCMAKSKTKANGPDRVRKGRDFTVRAAVKSGQLTPRGKVVLTWGDKVLDRGMLGDGRVRLTVKRDLPRGKRSLRARYLGNERFVGSFDKLTVRIVR